MTRTLWINWAVDSGKNVIMRGHVDQAEADFYPIVMGLDNRAHVRFACTEVEVPAAGVGIAPPAAVPVRLPGQRRSKAAPGECAMCDSLRERREDFHASHDASPTCRSGGYPHCSCNSCF